MIVHRIRPCTYILRVGEWPEGDNVMYTGATLAMNEEPWEWLLLFVNTMPVTLLNI